MKKYVPISIVILLSFWSLSYTAKVEPKTATEGWKDGKVGMNPLFLASNTALYPPALFGIKTVVIDAGHGGKDPGCLGITTSMEKDIALGIALKLGKYIEEKCPDVKVVYTRDKDVFIELDERAAIANRNNADLFICIHCNTACAINKSTKKKTCNEEVFGTETYVMGLHKTNANLNVAKRENDAMLLEKNYQKRYDGFDNSEAGYILLTMQQSKFLMQSINFAAKVQKQVKEKASRVDKGVQQAGFLVLWRTKMPSVLIETEFLSNTASEKFVVSEKGQDYMALSIFSAFRQYKDEVEGKLAKYEDDVENVAPFVPEKDTSSHKQPVIDKKESVPVKDTASIKEPVIENETKAEIASKDSSLVKNQMMPPVKEKLQVSSPKPQEKDSVKKIDVIKLPLPSDQGKIIYKVQFMSSGQRIPLLSDKFKGLKDVGEYEDNGMFKYTAGEFKTIEEAMKYRGEMQKKKVKKIVLWLSSRMGRG